MDKKKSFTPADGELYEKVRELHDSGLSFANIGLELGFSKQRAHQIYHQSPPDPETVQDAVHPDTRPSRGLTVRERRFVRGLIEGKSQRQAALDAIKPGQITPESASQWANKALNKPRVLTAFQELLIKHGLTEDRLIQTHLENLQATKVVATATENGKVTEIVERPDYRARQMAVRDGYRLWDRLEKKDVEEPPQPRMHVTLTLKRAQWISQISRTPIEDTISEIRFIDGDQPDGSEPPAPIEVEPGPDEPSLQGATAVDPADELDGTDEDEGVAANLPEEDQ